MIASLMAYCLVASALVAVGSRGIEEAFRTLRLPIRFVWLIALLGTVALTALAPLRERQPFLAKGAATTAARGPVASDDSPGGYESSTEPGPAAQVSSFGQARSLTSSEPRQTGALAAPAPTVPAFTESGPAQPASLALAGAREAVRRLLEFPLRIAAETSEGPVGRTLPYAWLLLSLTLLALGLITTHRYGRLRRGLPVAEVDGVRVRVTRSGGPILLGLLQPEIVVPDWLLASGPEERRMVIIHEREHLLAHDPLTLAAGFLVAVLLPWNPIVWW
ncbi:MAG TPA: M56 family metallopeptidase, partial [Longimicrobiaceae bacterium]|nr:M56 family metallopeptidase [Longimicrobiaceae bacterium]